MTLFYFKSNQNGNLPNQPVNVYFIIVKKKKRRKTRTRERKNESRPGNLPVIYNNKKLLTLPFKFTYFIN